MVEYGIIYHNMKTSRSQFKYAIMSTKRAEETARADALAADLSNKIVMNSGEV